MTKHQTIWFGGRPNLQSRVRWWIVLHFMPWRRIRANMPPVEPVPKRMAFALDDDYDSCVHDEWCLRRWLAMPAYKIERSSPRLLTIARILRVRPYCRHGTWWRPSNAVNEGHWV